MPFGIGRLDSYDIATEQTIQDFNFPFKIIGQTLEDGTTTQIGVISDSHLFNSEDGDTYEEDNSDWGLLTDDTPQDDPNWITVTAADQGKKVWLEIEVAQEDQSILSIDIRCDRVETDGAWTHYPDPIEINVNDDPQNPYQQFYHQIIGELTDFEEDPRDAQVVFGYGDQNEGNFFQLQVTQLLRTNLMMTTAHTTADADEPHLPLIVAIPWNAAGTDLGGLADEIPSEDNLMTPFALGEFQATNLYSFEMFDASTSDSSGSVLQVRIIDGDVIDQNDTVFTPDEMGNDDFIAGPLQDGSEIYLKITHDDKFNITLNPTVEWTDPSDPDVPDDDQTTSYVTLGYVNVNDSGNSLFPHNQVCGDYFFDAPIEENIYAFKMVDDSLGKDIATIFIYDGDVIDQNGDGQTPQGMGDDDFHIQVEDGNAIYLSIPYNHEDGTLLADSVTIGALDDTPDDVPGNQFVEIGYVEVEGDADNGFTVTTHNTVCGDYFFTPDEANAVYAFQISDSSNTDAPLSPPTYKVDIADGSVVDKNGNEHDPVGMGSDSFQIDINATDDDLYLTIPNDGNFNITGPITITAGQTPDDTETEAYITIGYVGKDEDTQLLNTFNVILGDYYYLPDPINTTFDFQIIDSSSGSEATVKIIDGTVYGPNDDGVFPEGMGLSNTFEINVSDGDDIYVEIHYDDGDQTVDSASIGVGNTPDNDVNASVMYETLGFVSVVFDSDGNANVSPVNEIAGDIIIPILPIARDNDEDVGDWIWHYDSDAESWKWMAMLEVTDDTDILEPVSEVTQFTFTYDAIDGAGEGAIVEPGDETDIGNEAVVHIGINVAGDDGTHINGVQTINFTYDYDEDQIVTETGTDDQNSALVHIGVNVTEVEGQDVNGVSTIEFENIDGVSDAGGNTANVKVLPDFPDDGTHILAVVYGDLQWLDTTTC